MGFLSKMGSTTHSTEHNVEILPSNSNHMSLDELYEIGSELGKVEIGGISGRSSVEIRVNFSGDDYVSLKCHKYYDVKQNFSEVIDKALKLKEFYSNL